jgi:hypothetical protein
LDKAQACDLTINCYKKRNKSGIAISYHFWICKENIAMQKKQAEKADKTSPVSKKILQYRRPP